MDKGWCDAPIQVELLPSKRLTAFHMLTHGGAVAALWYATLPVVPAALLTSAVVVHGLWRVRREWRLHDPRRIRRLVSLPDGAWRLVDGADREFQARLVPGSLVHPRFTVLAFRVRGQWRVRGVVLTTDNVAARPFRRLRVRLLLAERGQARN